MDLYVTILPEMRPKPASKALQVGHGNNLDDCYETDYDCRASQKIIAEVYSLFLRSKL